MDIVTPCNHYCHTFEHNVHFYKGIKSKMRESLGGVSHEMSGSFSFPLPSPVHGFIFATAEVQWLNMNSVIFVF